MIDVFFTPIRDKLIHSSWTTMELLLTTTIGLFLIWYVTFYWNRRSMYKLASKIHGPPALPIIGHVHLFLGPPEVVFDVVDGLRHIYSGVIKIWCVHKLFFGIQEPEDLEVVLNSPKALAKGEVYRFVETYLGHGLFSAPVPTWKKHRKLINPTFNQKILDTFVEIFSRQSNVLIDVMKPHCGKDELDILDLTSSFALDNICESAMGVNMNCQTVKAGFFVWADKVMEICIRRMFFIPYHSDFIFRRTSLYPREMEYANKCQEFSGKVVREKRLAYEKKMEEKRLYKDDYVEEPEKREVLLDSLIKLACEGTNFTNEELTDEVNTILVTGSDTSSVAIACAFLCLAVHQDVQQKVYEEVLDVIGPDRDFQPEDLPNLKYTERVIKESLRIFPVAPFTMRSLESDLELKSCTLPGNSSLFIMIHAVQTNPKYWPDPYNFDPDRFLPEEVAKRHPYTYLPFSAGPRNCIGLRYAMMQMKCVLGQVIRKYRFYTKYKHLKDVKIKSHIVMRPTYGYKLSIQHRTD